MIRCCTALNSFINIYISKSSFVHIFTMPLSSSKISSFPMFLVVKVLFLSTSGMKESSFVHVYLTVDFWHGK